MSLEAGNGLSALCSQAQQIDKFPQEFFPPCSHGDSLTCPQGLCGLAVKKIATNSWSELSGLTSARV